MEIIYAIVESGVVYNNPRLNAAFLTIDLYATHESTHTAAKYMLARSRSYFMEFFTLLKYQKLFRVFVRINENAYYFRKQDWNMSNIFSLGFKCNIMEYLDYNGIFMSGN